jgi:hypothetical protein
MPREKSPQAKLLDDVKNRFAQHPGTPQNDAIRADFGRLALKMAKTLPPSRETSLVLTKLEEASFFANAAVVRNPADASSDGLAPSPAKKAAKKTTRRVTRTPKA